jgi:hypothetical protein
LVSAAVDNPPPQLMEMEWSRLLSAAAADEEYKLVFIKNNYFLGILGRYIK